MVLAAGVIDHAAAATPPIPNISGPIAGPGRMYPDPPVSVTPNAVKVEDFPYLTEEYFVSGTIGDAPYTTRIIVRRPHDTTARSAAPSSPRRCTPAVDR